MVILNISSIYITYLLLAAAGMEAAAVNCKFMMNTLILTVSQCQLSKLLHAGPL